MRFVAIAAAAGISRSGAQALHGPDDVVATGMTSRITPKSLPDDLDRIALALDRLERAATAREAELGEMEALKARHRKLKDTVSNELQQLDLLLANLPQKSPLEQS